MLTVIVQTVLYKKYVLKNKKMQILSTNLISVECINNNKYVQCPHNIIIRIRFNGVEHILDLDTIYF